MWPVAFVVTLVSLVAAMAWALSLRAERKRLVAEHDSAKLRVDALQSQNHSLDKQVAEAQTKLGGIDEKFKALAGDVLQQSNEQFLQLARKAFDGEQKQAAGELEKRQQAIDALLKPVREALEAQNKTVQEMEKQRQHTDGSLRQQLTSMLEDQRRLRSETTNLANALRRSDVRGRWGELTLKRVAEMAGMVPYCDFDEQVTIWSGDDRQRPDMVVHLPSDRSIVIDAKTPMTGFLDAIEAGEPEERRRCMAKHLALLETRVRELASKSYAEQFERSPDFVVLFMAGDSFLTPAVELKPDLIEWALERGVVIATPTTLVSLLKVIELGWREERVAENARRISDLGQELHKRIAIATDHVERLGSSLDKAVQSYNQFVGSFETRIVSTARQFKDLGADSSKQLPADGQIKIIESKPRDLRPAS